MGELCPETASRRAEPTPGRRGRRSWEQLNAHSEQLNATMCRQGTVLVAFTLTSHRTQSHQVTGHVSASTTPGRAALLRPPPREGRAPASTTFGRAGARPSRVNGPSTSAAFGRHAPRRRGYFACPAATRRRMTGRHEEPYSKQCGSAPTAMYPRRLGAWRYFFVPWMRPCASR